MSSRFHKSSPASDHLSKLKNDKSPNNLSKKQPDIMTFADLVKGVTEKLMYPTRKSNHHCPLLASQISTKKVRKATSDAIKPVLTHGEPSRTIMLDEENKKIARTAVQIIERNKAALAQQSPKKNYFCFASEYLAGLEAIEQMQEEENRSPAEDLRNQRLRERIMDLHHAIGTPLVAIAEEEEEEESDKSLEDVVVVPRFKIPSRVKIPPRASSQSCLDQNQNAFNRKKWPGQPIRRRWHPRLENIVETVEVVC